MTFSIVARSGDSLGVATATRSLAVGGIVPAAAPGVGALATQARTNRAFRARGLELLAQGRAPQEVLARFGEEDGGYAERQVAVVDARGRAAVWTGPECLPWAGGWAREGMVLAGNLLTGPEVLEAMEEAFAAVAPGTALAEQLVAALTAGDAAGGDRRGRQSAAVLVVSGERMRAWPPRADVDLRVDDHAAPVEELGRLLALLREEDLPRESAAGEVAEGAAPDREAGPRVTACPARGR